MDRNRVDRKTVMENLRNKYPDMPEPGTQQWGDFLRKLKEESPEDYKAALLLGGAVTQALQKEIQRSQRRDQIKGLFHRLFMRPGRGGSVPHKRKIALFIFAVVGGLFLIAFFFGTAPKKEASGGGVGAAAAESLASRNENTSLDVGKAAAKDAKTGEESVPTVEAETDGKTFSLAAAVRESATGTTSETPNTTASNATAPNAGAFNAAAGIQTGTGVSPMTGNANLPPPPPPVYGYGSPAPPPPDASLAASGQTGQGGVAPPPLVLYQDTGTPDAPGAGSTVVSQPPAPATTASPSQGSGQGGGGMLFLTAPSSGMLVVQGANPGNMAVQGQITPEEPVPNPAALPPGAVPYTPVPPPGGVR